MWPSIQKIIEIGKKVFHLQQQTEINAADIKQLQEQVDALTDSLTKLTDRLDRLIEKQRDDVDHLRERQKDDRDRLREKMVDEQEKLLLSVKLALSEFEKRLQTDKDKCELE